MFRKKNKRSLTTLAPGIFTVAEVFSADECADLIDRAEHLGFEAATIGRKGGGRMMPGVRNNDRIKLEDPTLAALMWERIRDVLPRLDGCEPRGAFHELRFYRYSPGQHFRRHKDGVMKNPLGEASKLSYLIYLNDDCVGGATTFHSGPTGGDDETITQQINPQVGLALLFRHEFWHAGQPVTKGQKYLLRTDVFYGAE